MENILELSAETQAAMDVIKANCEPNCIPHDYDTCRQCWDMETEMERLMRLYNEVKDTTGR
jgi:hypothetical protein